MLSVEYSAMDYRHEVAQPTSRTYMSCTAEILCLSIGHFPIPPPCPTTGNHHSVLRFYEFDEVRELCDSFQVRYFAAPYICFSAITSVLAAVQTGENFGVRLYL